MNVVMRSPVATLANTAKTLALFFNTGLAGIEPTTYRLGGDRSIQLSYNPKFYQQLGIIKKLSQNL